MTKQRQLFSDEEYDDLDASPDFYEAWSRLPVVRRVRGLKIRWLDPLVDLGQERRAPPSLVRLHGR